MSDVLPLKTLITLIDSWGDAFEMLIHIIELWETWCKGVKPVGEPASLPISNVEVPSRQEQVRDAAASDLGSSSGLDLQPRRGFCVPSNLWTCGERVESTQTRWTPNATQEKTNVFCTHQWERLRNSRMEAEMVRTDFKLGKTGERNQWFIRLK